MTVTTSGATIRGLRGELARSSGPESSRLRSASSEATARLRTSTEQEPTEATAHRRTSTVTAHTKAILTPLITVPDTASPMARLDRVIRRQIVSSSHLLLPRSQPQAAVALQPLYNKVTSLPGWYGSSRKAMPRTRMLPKVPRDQLLDKDGKILWPSATPDDSTTSGTRRAAEDAVRGVVSAEKAHGSASVRDVVDAKKKLTAFAREALPIVSARDRAGSEGLERFIVELDEDPSDHGCQLLKGPLSPAHAEDAGQGLTATNKFITGV